MKRLLAAIALLGALTTMGGIAQAQEGGPTAGQSVFRTPADHPDWEIEVHALFAYYYGVGFGGGARLGIPLLQLITGHSGFGHSFNNAFNLSVGPDLFFDFLCCGVTYIGVPVHLDAQWNVYFTEHLSAFVEVGFVAQFDIFLGNGSGIYGNNLFYPWFDVAVGGRYHLGSAANGFPALIARLGSSGFTFGISF